MNLKKLTILILAGLGLTASLANAGCRNGSCGLRPRVSFGFNVGYRAPIVYGAPVVYARPAYVNPCEYGCCAMARPVIYHAPYVARPSFGFSCATGGCGFGFSI